MNPMPCLATHSPVLLHWVGGFSPVAIQTAAQTLKIRLAQDSGSSASKRRLFSTFVELAHNVLHYAPPLPSADSVLALPQGSMAVGLVEAGAEPIEAANTAVYWISCSNAVQREHVPRLTARLDAVRAMSLAQIKSAYREQLHNTAHSSNDCLSRGAGLGWLTIARDASAPLQYRIAMDDPSAAPHAVFQVKALI